MAAVATFDITFGFEDETKRKVSLAPFDPATFDSDTAKENIIKFNASDTATVAPLLLSDEGAECTGIIAAKIDVVDKRSINLND